MKILCATDGSEGGLAPVRFLANLPPRQSVHVHLVTVVDHEDEGDGSAILADAKHALGGFPGQVTTESARGNSTSEIVQSLLFAAEAFGADLIAVGASGSSAIARFLLGSVAEAIARHAPQSVLIARPQTGPLQEVIVGMDGSDNGRAAALFVATRFPLPPDCTLCLAHVGSQPTYVAPDASYTGMQGVQITEDANQKAQRAVYREMHTLVDELRAEGPYTTEAVTVSNGHPVTDLLRLAEEREAGLIVVGSRGLTGIERFLLGSVSDRVLRHAPCSVLVVKQP